MAVLPIILEGDPILRRKAVPVQKITKQLLKLSRDMLETMREAKGVGLAGPQVNASVRLIVVESGQNPIILFNPELIEAEGQVRDVEGCLSIPGKSAYVTRAAQVTVKGLNLEGKPIKVAGEGYFARALQHEIDHLDGILYLDHVESEANEEK